MAEHEDVELIWAEVPDATAYRVIIRDEITGEFVLKAASSEAHYAVPRDLIEPSHKYLWRVEVRKEPSEGWATLLPYLRLLLPPQQEEMVTYIQWPDQGALAYRVVIRDDTVREFVVKDGLTGTQYPVDWTVLSPHHTYRYRIQVYRDGVWSDDMPYRRLNPPLRLILSSAAQPRDSSEIPLGSSERLLFLFTIDTEINLRLMRHPELARGVEHQIFCVHAGKEFGINYMMDLLDHYGFKGTFFLDILLEYQFGPGALDPVIDSIQKRGHDIQLHLHTAPHLRFARNNELKALAPALVRDDADLFRRALNLAIGLFEKRVGKFPVAFRSGAYHLCDAFFPILAEFGLRIDSSLYPFKNCRVSPWIRTRTQPFWVNGVLEVPVSWMIYRMANATKVQQFALVKSGLGQPAAISAVAASTGTPPATLVYMAHSYSLLNEHRSDDDQLRQEWNRGFKAFCPPEDYAAVCLSRDAPMVFLGEPDEDRLGVLARSLATVAARPGVRALTFQDLHDRGLEQWFKRATPVDPVPVWHETARRAASTGTRCYSGSFLQHLEMSPNVWRSHD